MKIDTGLGMTKMGAQKMDDRIPHTQYSVKTIKEQPREKGEGMEYLVITTRIKDSVQLWVEEFETYNEAENWALYC